MIVNISLIFSIDASSFPKCFLVSVLPSILSLLQVDVFTTMNMLNMILFFQIECNETDAWLSMELMFHLSILPLTRQLTNISGNLWGKTLQVTVQTSSYIAYFWVSLQLEIYACYVSPFRELEHNGWSIFCYMLFMQRSILYLTNNFLVEKRTKWQNVK